MNQSETTSRSKQNHTIGFTFNSDWLINWCESFWPITKHTFHSQLKTALLETKATNVKDVSEKLEIC